MHLLHFLSFGLAAAQSLADVLATNQGNLSTLSTLLQTVPDLVSTLSAAQNITILAPSNDAFARLMARNPRSAELTRNPRLLAGVLQYHVLVGRVPAADISTTPRFQPTLLDTPFSNVTGGQRVQLALVNNTAMAFSGYKQAANVIRADVPFAGGIIHIIDSVLTVPANPAQTAINTGLTSLAGALTTAQLVDGVNSLTDISIFAPTNDAFEAIGSVVGSLSQQVLANILAYHVLANQIQFSTSMIAAGNPATFMTAQGTNITIRRENGALFVNSARVLIADILTTNGVIHVIDNVLNPSNSTVGPNAGAATQVPAFPGVTSVINSPFTTGIVPSSTFIPANVPLSGGSVDAMPGRTLILTAGGAALLAAML